MLSFLFPSRLSESSRREISRRLTVYGVCFGELGAVINELLGDCVPGLAISHAEVDVGA